MDERRMVIHKGRAIGLKRAFDAEIAEARSEGKRVVVIDRQTQEACDHPKRYVCRGCRHTPMRRTYVCPDCHTQWDERIDE